MNYNDCSKEELINKIFELQERYSKLEEYIKEKCSLNDTSVKVEAAKQKINWKAVERSITEEALRKSRLQLETELEDTKTLQSISAEILRGGDIKALYESIADAAMHLMRSEYASMQILHVDKNGMRKLKLLAYSGGYQQAVKFCNWVGTDSAGSANAEALRKERRVIVSNVEECEFMKGTEEKEAYLQAGILAIQTTPLYSRSGKLIGMISTHWKNPHEPSERELRLLDVLARQAADLMEQKLSEEMLRDSETKYRTLFEHLNEGFFLGEMIYDTDGNAVDYVHLAANPALDRVLGLKHDKIVGKTMKEVHLNVAPWLRILNLVAQTGESKVFAAFHEGLNRHYLVRVFSPKHGHFACLIQDVTESRNLEAKLKSQKEMFESVIENMHDALVICSKDGETVFMNAEARQQFGHHNGNLAVSSAHGNVEFYDMEHNLISEEALPSARVFRGEKIRNEKIIVKLPHGDKYTEINATPMYDYENKLTSAVVVHRDITQMIINQLELKDHQEKILRAEQEKRETIEAAMKVKDEFLYLITHEFKTPIAVISSVLQTIDFSFKNDIPEKLSRYLNMIKMNTNRQHRLVNNLLDITRLNSGYMKLNCQLVDIVYVTKVIVDSVEAYASQKQIELSFIPSFKQKETYLDEEKFERIMLNLLSNALKFTPKGKKIDVLLSTKRRRGKSFICVSVRDEGIGVPDDRKDIIFQRFGQADTSLSRQAEGTGLGLHLVNLLVKEMDGEISLESELDKGSTFTILLPLVKPSEALREVCCDIKGELMSRDERIIEAASIEFSDIYFD